MLTTLWQTVERGGCILNLQCIYSAAGSSRGQESVDHWEKGPSRVWGVGQETPGWQGEKNHGGCQGEKPAPFLRGESLGDPGSWEGRLCWGREGSAPQGSYHHVRKAWEASMGRWWKDSSHSAIMSGLSNTPKTRSTVAGERGEPVSLHPPLSCWAHWCQSELQWCSRYLRCWGRGLAQSEGTDPWNAFSGEWSWEAQG